MSIIGLINKIKSVNEADALSRQKGFSLLPMMLTITALASGAALYAQQQAQQHVRNQIQYANEDVRSLQEALYAYHMDNRSFPDTTCGTPGCVAQYLSDQGYYFGRTESPFGTPYDIGLTPEGNAALVTFESVNGRMAERTANTFQSGSVNGNRVNVPIGRPSREAVLTTFLHRTAQEGCPECNTMRTDINMSGNNIVNAGTIIAESIEAEDLDAIRITTEEFDVANRILIGGGAEISADGNGLAIKASNVEFTGGVSIAGNLESQGGSFTGFSNIEADSLSAESGTIDRLSTTSFETDSAQINTAEIASLSGETLDFQSGNFSTFETNELQANTGSIAELSGNSVSYNTATLDSVNATSARITSIDASQANLGTLSVDGALTAGSFNVSGTMNANTGQFASVRTGTLTADIGRFKNYHADNATFGSLSVSDRLDADNVTVANRLSADEASATDLNFTDAELHNVNLSGRLTTSNLTATNSNINNLTFTTASGESITISGDISARSGSFTQDVSARNGVFTNASSSRSSINQNRSLIDEYIQAWKACVNAGGCQ